MPLRVRADARGDDGFTLIELLVVVIVLPLIVGAIAIAFVAVISLQSSTALRTTNAGDAQVVSAHFESDVHAAAQLTTDSAVAACGPSGQTQVLAIEWQPQAIGSSVYQSVVSYVVIKSGKNKAGTTYSLVRQLCTSGVSTTPTSSTTLSYDVLGSLPGPSVTMVTGGPNPANGWVPTTQVTNVSWQIAESTFTYTVVAVPNASTAPAGLGTVASPADTCKLATPGTGYYARTLCFVDFSSYTNALESGNVHATNPLAGCPKISSGIPGTADTLTFNLCVQVSNPGPGSFPYHPSGADTWASCDPPTSPYYYQPVCAATLPTYYDPTGNGSEAFLGNNGFYTGVGGEPALYQTVLGSTVTLTFDNIAITGPTGTIAGWELTTGDAESTDQGESLSWETSSNPTTFNSSSNGVPFTLLPDDPSAPYGTQLDDIGNACQTTSNVSGAYNSWPDTDLLFTQSNSMVTCGATTSSDKTGTVLLEAPAPASMQVVLGGGADGGHQAVFIGVLLP